MPTKTEEKTSSRDYVNSFARGLEVIRVFTRAKPRMTLSEVAKATDMTRATARRFLLTLVQEGYMEADNKHFMLRPKVLDLGYSVLSSMEIWDVAQPIMQRLADKLQECCFAVVLQEHSVIYTARATSNRYVSVGISVGSHVPAHTVSSGRVLLAGLSEEELLKYLDEAELVKYTPNTITSKVKLKSEIDQTRLDGWAIVDQELEIGLRSISVPIKDATGKVVAALNVPCPSARISFDEMRTRVLTEMMTASNQITAGLMR